MTLAHSSSPFKRMHDFQSSYSPLQPPNLMQSLIEKDFLNSPTKSTLPYRSPLIKSPTKSFKPE